MGLKTEKPFVGVSQCLLGDAVRYDGQSKSNAIVIEKFSALFTLVPVCPEVEAGLSIPRPPVQLTVSIKNPKLTGRDDPTIDITDIMQQYCKTKSLKLNHLSGFIFKSRSPSCGLHSTPVFIKNKIATKNSQGIFARTVTTHTPALPVIEESNFSTTSINTFIHAVTTYKIKK